jgi:hypothetical protein
LRSRLPLLGEEGKVTDLFIWAEYFADSPRKKDESYRELENDKSYMLV